MITLNNCIGNIEETLIVKENNLFLKQITSFRKEDSFGQETYETTERFFLVSSYECYHTSDCPTSQDLIQISLVCLDEETGDEEERHVFLGFKDLIKLFNQG